MEIYGIPSFDEISQYTTEIKILPFSENGRPPLWNSISGFYFCLIFVISVSFYIGLRNFVKI